MTTLLLAIVTLQFFALLALYKRVDKAERDIFVSERSLDRAFAHEASTNARLHQLRDSLAEIYENSEAQTTLSILHAESMTRLQSQIDEMRRRPYFTPARGDN